MSFRRFAACLAACTAFLAPHSDAGGPTGQQYALSQLRATRAPLALSADGAWRLHVDEHDVLHRVSLADASRQSTVQLPHGVKVLAASRTGQKVAMSTSAGCIGLANFGEKPGDAAKLAWRTPGFADARGAVGPPSDGWIATMPAECTGPGDAPAIAISADGKLLATPDAVFETGSSRLVAAMPWTHDVLFVKFTERDTRLLVATADLGEAWESAEGPSGLDFTLWDLGTKTLVDVVSVGDTRLSSKDSLVADVSPQTGAVFYIDERRTDQARRAGQDPQVRPPFELVQLSPGACGAAPRTRAQVDGAGRSFVVDRYGRWFAWSDELDATADAADYARGLREQLVVQDMATGRQLARLTSKYTLDGLVATPDGRAIFALATQPLSDDGKPLAGWPVVPDRDQLVELKLPDAIVLANRDAPIASTAGFCPEPGELAHAREIARTQQPLQPIWTRDLGADDAMVQATHEALTSPRCNVLAFGAVAFTTPDGKLWLDTLASVAQTDRATGKTLQQRPTPRTSDVCSVVVPASGGFFNAQGDTLTWRPVDATADPSRRRLFERRPGWIAGFETSRQFPAEVVWRATSGTPAPKTADGLSLDVALADYDATGRRVAQHMIDAGSYEAGALADAEGVELQPPGVCQAADGAPLTSGYDWRAGEFDSLRGTACAPTGARLAFWTDITIAPRPSPESFRSPSMLGSDAALAVAIGSGERFAHVYDLTTRRELAQLDVASANPGPIIVSGRLVLVTVSDGAGHRALKAYSVP